MPKQILNTLYFGFCLVILVAVSPRIGSADPYETKWQGTDKSQLRLITAQTSWRGKPRLFAGIEIRLAPKWKTYWRTPGDTGIPPFFDWQGSTNLLKAEVLYPFPVRFQDAGSTSIGYKSNVTLPVVITPKDASKPVHLKLNASYAICYDLCVPVTAQQELMIKSPASSPFSQVVDFALSDVPLPVSKDHSTGIKKIEFLSANKKTLNVKVKVPKKTREVDLFIERADGRYLPMPKQVEKTSTDETVDLTYKIDLSGLDKPDQIANAQLTCSLRVDSQAVEQPCNVE